ncbi:hypothetical protein EQH57_1194, partial [Dictyocoela roeselum]
NPDNSIIESEENFKFRLTDCHSSALIDYKGNLDVQLLMVVSDNGQNLLVNLKGDEILTLPKEIGPVIFNDFDNDGELEVAYISREDRNYFLNIQKMTGKKQNFRLDLKNEFGDKYDPVLRSKYLDNLHCGIFAADLERMGKMDIILTLMDYEKQTTVLKIISVFDKKDGIR